MGKVPRADRKSLMLYKLRGQRIIQGEHGEITGSLDPWTTRVFREQRNDRLRYSAEAEYPYFSPNEYAWADEVNVYIQATVMSETQGVRNIANEAPWTWAHVRPDEGESAFGGAFEIIFFHPPLLSIRLSFFAYYFGAAHANNWTRTVNLFLDPVYKIKLEHFFGFNANYLRQVSQAVRAKLTSGNLDNEGYFAEEWVHKGTEPEQQNFANYNFSTSGFLFTFDQYRVAAFAAGRQEIWVPFRELSGLVLPNDLT